ncbi:MAG: protein-glutamate O-methyltransferase CheR [bacterium]
MMDLSEKDFNLIRGVIYEQTGIRMSDNKQILVANRLLKRLRALGMDSYADYCAMISEGKASEGELGELINCLTTNETYFFREYKHFDILNETVFPAYANTPGKTLYVWSAGCSTGQEPYSIAIAALEYNSRNSSGVSVSVMATDVSSEVLETAREGLYPENKTRGVSEEQLNKFFKKTDSGYLINKEAKSLVRFQKMNLLNERLPSKFNVIFCRNVMIYFDQESQERVVDNLHGHLNQDGLLFVGHSEALLRFSSKFNADRIAGTTVYRKPA